MYCEECGVQLPDTAKFCPNCGTKIVRKGITSPLNITNTNDNTKANPVNITNTNDNTKGSIQSVNNNKDNQKITINEPVYSTAEDNKDVKKIVYTKTNTRLWAILSIIFGLMSGMASSVVGFVFGIFSITNTKHKILSLVGLAICLDGLITSLMVVLGSSPASPAVQSNVATSENNVISESKRTDEADVVESKEDNDIEAKKEEKPALDVFSEDKLINLFLNMINNRTNGSIAAGESVEPSNSFDYENHMENQIIKVAHITYPEDQITVRLDGNESEKLLSTIVTMLDSSISAEAIEEGIAKLQSGEYGSYEDPLQLGQIEVNCYFTTTKESVVPIYDLLIPDISNIKEEDSIVVQSIEVFDFCSDPHINYWINAYNTISKSPITPEMVREENNEAVISIGDIHCSISHILSNYTVSVTLIKENDEFINDPVYAILRDFVISVNGSVTEEEFYEVYNNMQNAYSKSTGESTLSTGRSLHYSCVQYPEGGYQFTVYSMMPENEL